MLRRSFWNTFIPVNLIDYLALYPAVDHRMIQFLITTRQNRRLQDELHTSCNPKIVGSFWARVFLYDRMHFPWPWGPSLKQNVIPSDWVVSNSMLAWRQVYQQQYKKMLGLCLIGLLVSLNMTSTQLQQLVRTAHLIMIASISPSRWSSMFTLARWSTNRPRWKGSPRISDWHHRALSPTNSAPATNAGRSPLISCT